MLKRTRDQGVAILTVIVAVIIIGGVSSAFFLLSYHESQENVRNRDRARATYLAEAGTEIAANLLRQAIANNPLVMSDPNDPNTATAPAYNTLVVNQKVTIDGVSVQCKAMKRQVINSVAKAGALRVRYASFELMGYARYGGKPGATKDNAAQEAVVYKMVETNGTPLFQFLAFYDGDLELNPGPFAHFHGRMHTNSDMYLTDRDTTKGLIVDSDHVQAVGKMYRSYSSRTTNHAMGSTAVDTGAVGDVWVRKTDSTPINDSLIDAAPWSDPGMIKWDLSLNSDSSGFSKTATDNWNGTVKDGSMGAEKMVPPQIESIKPGGFYDNQAATDGLRIIDGKAMLGGTDVTADINSAAPGAITTSKIFDARENIDVPLTTVDVGKLFGTKYRPRNGIIYAHSTTATAKAPEGVQLINGSYIAPPPSTDYKAGLTVATTLPVYVQGDYNGYTDRTTGASLQDRNAANELVNYTLDPSGNKVQTAPAAIIADAVNMLSRDWNNSKTSGSAPPKASNTTYNTAIIAGNQDTSYDSSAYGSGYNGGLQNLPRFHENWDKIKANISGSFVNLWRSQIATGVYGKGNVYSPPERHWDFDQKFDKPGNDPPGTPFTVSVGRTTYEEGLVRGVTLVGGAYKAYDLMPDY